MYWVGFLQYIQDRSYQGGDGDDDDGGDVDNVDDDEDDVDVDDVDDDDDVETHFSTACKWRIGLIKAFSLNGVMVMMMVEVVLC